MPFDDPLMAVADLLPATRSRKVRCDRRDTVERRAPLFGLRFAVAPVSPCADRHKKTYYTVTVKEATKITNDGTVEVVQDDVEKERED